MCKPAALIALGSVLVACGGGSEEVGRIRVTVSEVAGVYKSGPERLELRANGTYVQDVASDSQLIHHTDQWRVIYHFFGGSQVLLINAAVISTAIPKDKDPHPDFADVVVYAHSHYGKVALARNEVADWYYERSR